MSSGFLKQLMFSTVRLANGSQRFAVLFRHAHSPRFQTPAQVPKRLFPKEIVVMIKTANKTEFNRVRRYEHERIGSSLKAVGKNL